MNYIIYDLELNQKYSKEDNCHDLPFEIIQIGALKLNNKLETISTFNALVKPTVYNDIHPYIEALTKISNDMVNSHNTFPKVYKDFLNFIGNEDFVFCTWGTSDIKELIRNIEFHNLNHKTIINKYIDVQNIASKYLNAPKGTRIGLQNAVEVFDIRCSGNFHNAFNDAYYTAEIFKELYTTNIKIKVLKP